MALKEKKIKRWCVATVTILAAGLLAVAANSPNLIMSNKYAKETMRGGHSELTATDNAKPAETTTSDGLSKEYITQWSYGIDETLTLLVPNANGGTSNKSLAETSKFEDMQYSGDLDDLSSQAMPIFTQYFGDQPFTSGPVYVGALIFALFIIGCIVVKGPIKWMLLAVTLLSILLSWGHNFMSLTDFFIDCVPFYNKFRTVSSILVIAEFTMPLLAVLGLHKLFTAKDENKSKNELALYIGFGVSALICLMFVLMPGAGITDADNRVFTMASGGEMGQLADHPELCKNIVDLRNSLVSADALYALMIVIFGFGVLFTYMKWWRKVSPMVPSLILAGIVLIDLVVVDKRYLNSEAFTPAEMVTEAKFEKTPADEQILKDTTMNYRVLDVAHFMEPRSSYYHKTVGGYHAAKLTRYNDLIEKQLTKNNMAVINMLNTKYFMIDENQIQPNPEALGNAWWVDSLEYVDNADAEMKFLDDFDPSKVAVADKKFKEALGAAETTEPGDTIFETTYAPNSLTYHSHSAKGGIAVFSEIYFPWGWTATVDGKEVPIGRVNYVLRALRLPAGDHTIVFKFDPQEVHKTVSVATIAVIVILLLAVAALAMPWFGQLLRRKKENEVEQQ